MPLAVVEHLIDRMAPDFLDPGLDPHSGAERLEPSGAEPAVTVAIAVHPPDRTERAPVPGRKLVALEENPLPDSEGFFLVSHATPGRLSGNRVHVEPIVFVVDTDPGIDNGN
ncbi:MAG TPA: hypothetical protein VM123_10840 [archaeon]|nr:hypothetical protein [archaeon]